MKRPIILVFPGQGSQYVGMGARLEGHRSFEFMEKADKILNKKLSKIMLEGPEEELKQTENTQPAILTYSLGLYDQVMDLLDKYQLKVTKVLGHSVGEYSALVAAGSLSFDDAVSLVHMRGKFMQEAVPAGKGKMFALLKVPEDMVYRACQNVNRPGFKVMPANFNEPNQIVISGDAGACEEAIKWLEENYADPFRSVELQVSAPFHSSLMKPAADKLKIELNSKPIRENKIPYIANVNSKKYESGTGPEVIKENLFNQVAGSVLWYQSFSQIPDDALCIEVGPGKVLKGLARKINRNIKVISLDSDGAFLDVENFIRENI